MKSIFLYLGLSALLVSQTAYSEQFLKNSCLSVFGPEGTENNVLGVVPETGDLFSASLVSGSFTPDPNHSYLSFDSGSMYYWHYKDDTESQYNLSKSSEVLNACMLQLALFSDISLNWQNEILPTEFTKFQYGISMDVPVIEHCFTGYVVNGDEQNLAFFCSFPNVTTDRKQATALLSQKFSNNEQRVTEHLFRTMLPHKASSASEGLKQLLRRGDDIISTGVYNETINSLKQY